MSRRNTKSIQGISGTPPNRTYNFRYGYGTLTLKHEMAERKNKTKKTTTKNTCRPAARPSRRETDRRTDRQTDRELELENKDCSLGSVKTCLTTSPCY